MRDEPTLRHRHQVWLQIGLPIGGAALLLLAVGIALALSPTGAEQGGAAAAILLALLCMVGGLPWLVALVALVLWLARAPQPTRRALRRGAEQAARLAAMARRWTDRLSAPVIAAETTRARWQALRRLAQPQPQPPRQATREEGVESP